jgi:hypothetical protein
MLAVALACEAAVPAGSADEPGLDSLGAGPSGVIAGTPPGGLEDWVAAIREGLAGLPGVVAADTAGALQRALDLYVGRQEFIELYWGPSGRLSGDAVGLGASVLEAESRFHELLQLLAAPPVDTATVRGKTAELFAQLDRVLVEARQAGVVLIPPGNALATTR